MTPPDVIDAAALARLAQLRELAGHDVLGELVVLFVREVPPQIAACVDALASADPEALRRAAHGARGSAATLGATELAALCARVEDGAPAAWPGELPALVGALDPAFLRARTALERLAADTGPAAS